MNISRLGEFGLIDIISRQNKASGKSVVLGIGDDAAAVRSPGPKKITLITTDTLVENVHFKLKYSSFYELGWKLAAANLSDIAAMGGIPKYALVTLGLRRAINVKSIKQFYAGIKALAGKYHVQVIGGDIVSSPKALFFTMDMIGEADRIVKRSGARAGDIICAFGKFGASAAGLSALNRYGRKAKGSKAHLMPVPLLKESRLAAKHATAMIDNSDGLARCIREICKASKVGANIEIDKVPLASGATIKQAFDGGEDYNLVFTMPKSKLMRVRGAAVIGRMVKGRNITLINSAGKARKLTNRGFEHF